MTEKPSNNRIGQQFGSFEITRFLGRGGFADVFLGKNVNLLQQEVAIKVLDKMMIQYEKAEQFKQEAQIILTLRHPSIVQFYLYDIYWNPSETNTGYPYIVMEYASKGSLRNMHPRGTRLPLEQMMIYVKQVSRALDYAHNNRVMHLDVKPENILVNKQGKLLLSDFGLATVIDDRRRSTDIQGTLSYMAPEQLEGYPVKASDQYSLAVMTYEWISGTVPFMGRSFQEHVEKVLREPPPLLTARVATLNPAVEAVVMRALSKKPQDRYASVRQFAEQLEKAITDPKQLISTPQRPAIAAPVQAPEPLNQAKQAQVPTPPAPILQPKQAEEVHVMQPTAAQKGPEDPGLPPLNPPIAIKKDSKPLDPQLANDFERYERHLVYYGTSMQKPPHWDDPDFDFPIPLRLAALQTDQIALQAFIDKNLSRYRTYLDKFEQKPSSLDAFNTCRYCFAVRYGQRASGTPANRLLQWPEVLQQLLAQVKHPDLQQLVKDDLTLTPAADPAQQDVNQPVHVVEEHHDDGSIPVQPGAAGSTGSPFLPGWPPKREVSEADNQSSLTSEGAPQPEISITATFDSQYAPSMGTYSIDNRPGGVPPTKSNSPFIDGTPQKTQHTAGHQYDGGAGTPHSQTPFYGYESSASFQPERPDINNIRIGPLAGSFDPNNAQTVRAMNFMDEPSPPIIPPYLRGSGNGGMYEPDEISIQDMFNQTMHDIIQPRRGRRRVTSSPYFYVFAAGSIIGSLFFAAWLGHEYPSTDNGLAWTGLIVSLGLSIGMYVLFDYSDSGFIKIVAASILAFVWCLIGYAFAAIIGGGSHIGILPGPPIMALFFFFGTLILCLRKIIRPR